MNTGDSFLRPSTTMGELWLVLIAPGQVFESTRRSGKWLYQRAMMRWMARG